MRGAFAAGRYILTPCLSVGVLDCDHHLGSVACLSQSAHKDDEISVDCPAWRVLAPAESRAALGFLTRGTVEVCVGDLRDDVERRAAIAPLLDGLGEGDRRRVIEACIRRSFRRGQALFHEGDPGESLHFLTSGFVVVQVTTPLGEIATINVMGAPDTVGELALLDRCGRRSASVVAITPVETLALDRGAFERLRTEHPVVERMLVTILSVHVRRLSDRLTEALYVPAETRVFLRLADLFRVFGGERTETAIPVTQSDLAAMAGTTRPTVNRALQAAQSSGAILLGRGRIEVVEPNVLEELAASPTHSWS
jgi:CRP/FNR family transcriptional regulator, cyclic AMP receptor protein